MKRFLCLMLAAALSLALLPVAALADTAGDLTITGGVLNTDYSYDGTARTLTILTGTAMTISGTTTQNVIIVAAGVTANLTISNLSISLAGSNAPLTVSENATLNLTINGMNTLTAQKAIYCATAGLYVHNNGTLVITAQSTGTLNAYGGIGAAGIGGNGDYNLNYSYTGGSITINGGTINAYGGDNGIGSTESGAGIGCGWTFAESGASSMTINGGIVTATGGSHSAGIGGGYHGNCGTVIITGGQVTANGAGDGSGIGSGLAGGSASGGRIYISGGIVNATGSGFGAGIGGAMAGPRVFVSGGTVTATGGAVGAGIGGAKDSVYYSDGTLIATGGSIMTNDMVADVFYDDYTTTAYPVVAALENVTASTPITSLTVSLNNAGYTYLIKDVFTDADGKLYLYLPAGATVTAAQTASNYYAGSVTASSSATVEGTLYLTAGPVVEPSYALRTLTDSATGISVSGMIRDDAALTVGEMSLGNDVGCTAIRERLNDADYILLLGKNIALSGGFSGTLTISIPVGAQYNGETLTILHCNYGALETISAVVKDGKATFSVNNLSPFAVFTLDGAQQVPVTADVGANPVWGVLSGVLGAVIIALIIVRKERKR